MGQRIHVRVLTVILFVITGVLIVLYQVMLTGVGDALPPGGRQKLPTGPVRPMVSMGATHGVILAGDGSLWWWGINPTDRNQQGSNGLFAPVRFSPDTNWVYVTLRANILLAIKSDGTLWAGGWSAQLYGASTNWESNARPMQVGTDADWRAIAGSSDARFDLLTKKDGSLWAMIVTGDASPAKPIVLTRVKLDKEFISLGAAANGSGMNSGIGLTRDGEVWTWGLVLGQETRAHPTFQALAEFARKSGRNVRWGDPQPIVREKPWLLPNVEPGAEK